MMSRFPAPLGVAALALVATACGASSSMPSSEDFADSEAEGAQDLDEPEFPELPPMGDALVDQLDYDEIIDGFVYDSDRDVRVSYFGSICTGTLLRNDVVLTAKHCVSTDGTIDGPEAAANTITVTQDGPGASLGASRSVTTIVRMATRDVAMLRLSSALAIDGETTGRSTQILGAPQSTVVGDHVLCQGYGHDTCANTGAGTLRAGLVAITGSSGGMLTYGQIPGYDWIQWKGDSGSSCRSGVFDPPNLRKAISVTSTGSCGGPVNEVGPDLYRDWAHDQMNNWAGGDFFDGFSAALDYDVDEPAGMVQGPSNWQVSGGTLTENTNAYTNTTFHEGTRYVNAAQVASDATVHVTVSSADNDAAGLVLRYRDPTHYYRLSFDEQRRFARIVKRSGNTWTVIAEDTDFDIDWSTSPKLSFYAWNNLLGALVDGKLELLALDPDYTYTAGRAGIYTWGLTNASFDDFEIDRF